MGTLGKVLLGVNLLAALGLTYFAAQSWTRRQEVQAQVLRRHVALKGLPVEGGPPADENAIPFAVELTGGQATTTVRKSFLAAHFQGADGGGTYGDTAPPVSQLAELGRVKAKVKATLAGMGGQPERLAYLCGSLNGTSFTPGLLARLAGSYEERAAVVDLATAGGDPATAVQTAEAALDARFAAAETISESQAAADATKVKEAIDAVKKAAADAKAAYDAWQQNAADANALQTYTMALDGLRKAQAAQGKAVLELGTASRSAPDRRRRIANLLSELDPSAGWQKRTALVVGLREYRESVGQRVDRLREFARSAQSQAVADQAEFTEQYLLLKEQAAARTLVLDQQKLLTAELVAQQAKEREVTAVRRKQFTARLADLAAVKADVAALLTKQTATEGELFGLEKRVADALRANFALEEQLRQAEYKGGGQ